MRKKFRSETKARAFARTTKMKIKKGPKCKMADGTKGNWFTLTKTKKRK